jgi:hypothetical protein
MAAQTPTLEDIVRYLAAHNLVVVPRASPLPVRWPSSGGGGAAFTGVRGGTYAFGGGSITINGKGQVTAITAGGAGGGLEVQDEGTTVVPLALVMDFRGAGVTATLVGSNTARIEIPGGSTPPSTQEFTDDVTTDIVVGDTTDGLIVVDASISKDNDESTAFRFMFGSSATGVTMDCLQVDSNVPVTDIEPQSAISGTDIILRLVGTGIGIDSAISYRITTLPRLLP